MSSDKVLQPIIIKKVKKKGHAAHGGAWKIAYADFVTAMMAFFLLMWLLGSINEGDKKGIEDYFNTPMKLALGGGPSSGATHSIITGGGQNLAATQKTPGSAPDTRRVYKDGEVTAEAAKREAQKLAELSKKIRAKIDTSSTLIQFKSQIRLEVTPDGLLIQIVDDQNRPMFNSGSATIQPHMTGILQEIGSALQDVDNKISVEGHTDATTYGASESHYSNWELSSDRANASRRALAAGGMPSEKLARVVGLGSSDPMDRENPTNPLNRRISVLIMTKDAQERMMTRVPHPETAASPVATPEAAL